MTVRLRYEQTCVVHSCLRPVWAAGGYCVQHYMQLSAAQRAALEWEASQPTEELDPDRLRECVWLEALLAVELADSEVPPEERAA